MQTIKYTPKGVCARQMEIDIEDGKIVGKGTHDDLYQSCAEYKDMYDSQYEGLKNKAKA